MFFYLTFQQRDFILELFFFRFNFIEFLCVA